MSYALVLRLGVVASALAMLLFCARAAQAQDDDRYGFVKVPGEQGAPMMPVGPAQAAGPQYAVAQPMGGAAGYGANQGSVPGYLLGTGDKIKITS